MDKEVFKTCFKDIKIIRFHKNILKRKILSEANKCFLSIKSSFVIVKKNLSTLVAAIKLKEI